MTEPTATEAPAMRMAMPNPAGEHRPTSRITTNGAERGAANTGRAAVVGARLHAEQVAQCFRRYLTTITTTGNVTAASSVPSATAPDTGFTSR